jgi:hypothetical protein
MVLAATPCWFRYNLAGVAEMEKLCCARAGAVEKRRVVAQAAENSRGTV